MGRKTHGPYLVAAIEYNDIAKVSEILVKQFRDRRAIPDLLVSEIPRLASEYTEIPLLLAASLPDAKILRYFVSKHSVDINHVFESGSHRSRRRTTALLTSVCCGQHETVDALLSLNADVNVGDQKGRRPLHHAIRHADYRMVKMLVSHGARVNEADVAGNTALHTATIYGHTELVKLLLLNAADVYKRGQHGALAIHMAAHEGHANLVRLFCQFSEVNPNTKVPCYDRKEKGALHVAAEGGHSETVFTLLQHCDAGVDIRDSEGETPLHCAVVNEYDRFGMKSKEDFTEVVKILVNYGADVNAQNARGETAMHLAARNEFQKAIEVLVLAGCDPVSEDNDGNQAVDLTSDGDTVSVQILRHAASERERYLSESMEIRARGFTTLSQSQAALPWCIRSPSLLSMPVLMGAANSPHNLTRTASNPGLLASPPQSAMFSGLPVRNGYMGPGIMNPQLLDRSACVSPVTSSHPCNDHSPNGNVVAGNRNSHLSHATASTDNGLRLSGIVLDQTRSGKPAAKLHAPSEQSSLWNVTPRSSVNIPEPNPKPSELIATKNIPHHRKRKVIKKKPNLQVSAALLENSASYSEEVMSKETSSGPVSKPTYDETDSYFDDDSFDTLSESCLSEEAAEVPPSLPPRSSHVSSISTETSLRGWLKNQVAITHKRLVCPHCNVTSDAKSVCSHMTGTTATSMPQRPPKVPSRAPSVSSNSTFKHRPQPPIPREAPAEKPKRSKKPSNELVAPAQHVSEFHSDDEDRRKHKGKKKKHSKNKDEEKHHRSQPPAEQQAQRHRDHDVPENVYVNKPAPVHYQSVGLSPSLNWTAGNGIPNEQNAFAAQLYQQPTAQLAAVVRPVHPLVFEKVTAEDSRIADDYLFHKFNYELTSASAETIVECVARRMSNDTSPTERSSPNSGVSSAVRVTNVGYSPPPMFDFSRQTGFPNSTAQTRYPAATVVQQNPAQNAATGSPTGSSEPHMHWMLSHNGVPYQHLHPNPSAPQSLPLPQQQRLSDSIHSQTTDVSPDRQSSATFYSNLTESKSNERVSATSDDLAPPCGLNRRTVVLESSGKLGLTVCGGNVSGTFVHTVGANSHAAAAGLTAGDWIIAVNGKVVKPYSKQDVQEMIESLAPNSVRLVVERDDDRFMLAASTNAVGDSIYVRAHYTCTPVVKSRELAVKEEDIFQVSDSIPPDAEGYWIAKKVNGTVGEPEGLIPNTRKAEQIVAKQRLTTQTGNRPRGGVFRRSFRRSKYDHSSAQDQDELDPKQLSEFGDIVPYVRVVEQSSSVRRPVVIMGLFCDMVCALLEKDTSGIFETPKTTIEQRSASDDFSPKVMDVDTVRGIVNSGRHCAMVVSPQAVQYLREKTELHPIVIYMSPSSKSVLRTMIQQMVPACDKKPGFMLDESAKFERFHAALFDAVIPYKVDGSWLELLKDTIGRLQRQRRWIPFVTEDKYISTNSSPPDLIRTNRPLRNDDRQTGRTSRTTDDIPDQIQDLLTRHINIVSPMVSNRSPEDTNDLCTRSFDLDVLPSQKHSVQDPRNQSSVASYQVPTNTGPKEQVDKLPGVPLKPPKPPSMCSAVVLRRPPTKGRLTTYGVPSSRVTEL